MTKKSWVLLITTLINSIDTMFLMDSILATIILSADNYLTKYPCMYISEIDLT
jgi:hypothetical protein